MYLTWILKSQIFETRANLTQIASNSACPRVSTHLAAVGGRDAAWTPGVAVVLVTGGGVRVLLLTGAPVVVVVVRVGMRVVGEHFALFKLNAVVETFVFDVVSTRLWEREKVSVMRVER